LRDGADASAATDTSTTTDASTTGGDASTNDGDHLDPAYR
jgi:hypothetical protein